METVITYKDVFSALKTKRFVLSNEKDVQAAIANALTEKGFQFKREYFFDEKSIIDFLIEPRIGMEVKIKGSKREIYRQLERYSLFAKEIDILILASSKGMKLPNEINGIRCFVLNLSTAWL